MRVAIPTWNSIVSPVFDAAREVVVIDVDGGAVVSRKTVGMSDPALPRRAALLGELGVDLAICGAISRHFAEMLSASGIGLIPWISGRVDDVVAAFLNGDSVDSRFLMPGCRRGGRRGAGGHRRRGCWQEEER